MTISNSRSIVGYVTPRQFGQFNMPVPAQNSCLREYASANGFAYALPQCEHIYDDCYVQFFGTLMSLPENHHMVIYSILMLPEREADIEALCQVLESKSISIHTVLEKIVVRGRADIERQKQLGAIRSIIRINSDLLSSNRGGIVSQG